MALGPANYIFATQDQLQTFTNFFLVPQFAPGANGNAAPNLVLNTKSQGVIAQAVAVDSSGDLWVVGRAAYGSTNAAILEYAPNAHGAATPIKVISGPKTELGLLGVPSSLALDPSGNIWVASVSNVSRNASGIEEFAATASGNVPPIATIVGSKTDLSFPLQVTIDTSSYGNDRILVADPRSGTNGVVLVFAPESSGNVKPVAVITSVQDPCGVVTDSSGHIYISSRANNAIHEFADDANGNANPIASLHGSNTRLSAPTNLAIRAL